MVNIKHFTFNPFQENMYVLSDETKECIIIDPGCYQRHEQEELETYIAQNGLKPVRLLNTHCHIDHVLGNHFVATTFDLGPEMHQADLPTLGMVQRSADLYGIPGYETSPEPSNFLEESDTVEFGATKLEILFVPGHAPGHIAFVSHAQKFVIGGDVLFHGSIGRTDLPGGDLETLIDSIKSKFFALGDDYEVFSGHGPVTKIGFEKANNPWLQ